LETLSFFLWMMDGYNLMATASFAVYSLFKQNYHIL